MDLGRGSCDLCDLRKTIMSYRASLRLDKGISRAQTLAATLIASKPFSIHMGAGAWPGIYGPKMETHGFILGS